VILGARDYDSDLVEVRGLGIAVHTAPEIIADGPAVVGQRVVQRWADRDGYFVHLDADVLDPEVMPAVDSPDPGGLDHPQLAELLRPLVADPACVGLQITIYDPDLDVDGRHAAALADTIVQALLDRTA
jgi:arginase